MYGLPSAFELLENPPSRSEWKDLLNNSVNSVTETEWKKDVQDKSSIRLRYVNPDVLRVGKCHTIWSTVRNNVTERRRAQLKCKLLTGSYILQANRAVFNQFQVDPTCKLCCAAPETPQHYIAECFAFEMERDSFKQKVTQRL